MARINQNFEMWQGDTKEVFIRVYDPEDNYYDITGAQVKWKMKMQVFNGPEPTLVKETGNGITIPDPLRGLIRIQIDPEDTEAMPAGYYYHEAQLIEADGAVSVITVGRVTLNPSVN
jgi:hypothetical protein